MHHHCSLDDDDEIIPIQWLNDDEGDDDSDDGDCDRNCIDNKQYW